MNTNHIEHIQDTPTIPQRLFADLPTFLKDITEKFDDEREKDIILTSSLVILSGCFHSVKGKYKTDWVGPNLFGFIVAPPASGKSVMQFTRYLGKKIQDEFLKNNLELKEKYERQLKEWKNKPKTDGINSGGVPSKPKYPMLFIPGNSSSAANYKLLSDSDGIGIICSTEADSLSSAMKNEWGNYSNMFRAAFHHEVIEKARFTNDEYISIEKPCLSILLTGTPDQVPRLLVSAEDGLTSRFMFYCYTRELKWLDVTPCGDCEDLTEYFIAKGEKVAEIKKQLDSAKFTFSLSDDQFSSLNANFTDKLRMIERFEGARASSAVFRLGVIAFRIAMLLTILRNEDNLSSGRHLHCSDQDFNTAMALIDVYFEHSMIIYSLLPKSRVASGNPRLRRFYTLLPIDEEFERKKANEIGTEIPISEKTVNNYIQQLIKQGLLVSPSYGKFRKPAIQ